MKWEYVHIWDFEMKSAIQGACDRSAKFSNLVIGKSITGKLNDGVLLPTFVYDAVFGPNAIPGIDLEDQLIKMFG